jgi:hypothetical protein
MPETEGVTLEEIERRMSERKPRKQMSDVAERMTLEMSCKSEE